MTRTPLLLLLATSLGLCIAACTRTEAVDEAYEAAFADTEQGDTAGLVLRVRNTSRLHTAEYHVHKIVTHRDILRLRGQLLGRKFEAPLNLGDRKIAIPIDVTLRAYVDFSDFSQDNIQRSPDGNTLHVILPDPKVVVASSRVDHARTRQYADLLRSAYTDEEMTAFTRQGVQAIVRSIPQMGIIETARESAAATLLPLFASMGFDETRVVVTFRKEHFTTSDLPQLYDREATRRSLGGKKLTNKP